MGGAPDEELLWVSLAVLYGPWSEESPMDVSDNLLLVGGAMSRGLEASELVLERSLLAPSLGRDTT